VHRAAKSDALQTITLPGGKHDGPRYYGVDILCHRVVYKNGVTSKLEFDIINIFIFTSVISR
jgi:hypothetical protein